MRITINLATRPFTDLAPALRRLRIAMGVLAVLAIGFGFGLHALHTKAEAARARVHSLDGSLSRLQQERQGFEAMMQKPENATVLTESENLNALFDEKSFSWTLAMEDLETVLPGGVQVTTLEPVRDKTGRITLRLRVVGPRDKAVALVQNLEHSRHFLLPRIVGESSEASGSAGERMEPVSESNRVNFDLLADYNPATLREPVTETRPVAKEEQHKASDELAVPRTQGPGLRQVPGTGTPKPHVPQRMPHPGGAG